MPLPENEWLDEEAGPVVRPYAMTRGRTRTSGATFDLVAEITTTDLAVPVDAGFGPEHTAMLRLCRHPRSVAEVAATTDLPLGVVRVLLNDLLDQRLIRVRDTTSVDQLSDQGVLREVIDGLRAL